jgi:hypothetical protein
MQKKNILIVSSISNDTKQINSYCEKIIKLSQCENIEKIIIAKVNCDEISEDKRASIKTKLAQTNKVHNIIFSPWIESISTEFSNCNMDIDFKQIDDLDIGTLRASDNRFIDHMCIPYNKRNQSFIDITLIYDTYNFWIKFFQKNKIDLVYGEIEHCSADSIIYKAAKKADVPKILIPYPAGLSDVNQQKYFMLNLKNNMPEITTSLKNVESDTSILFGDWGIDELIQKAQSKNIFNKIYFYLNPHIWFNTKFFIQKTSIVLSKHKHIKQIQLIKKHYQNISNLPNFNEKYIIYYLHFEPEAAISPIAGKYSNQLLNIRILASSLPSGWKLYVKEHPTQFKIDLYKKLGYQRQGKDFPKYRGKKFYDYINALDNVKLISLNTNPKELVQNAQIIASISGSVIVEASNFNKPCIMFCAKSLYSLFNNAWVVKDTYECKLAINEIIKSSEIKSNFQNILNQYTFQCSPEKHAIEILIDILNKDSNSTYKTKQSKLTSISIKENA